MASMERSRSLVLVDDDELLDDLLRLAAAAGCELERAPDVAAARLSWSGAPLVLLDESAAQSCARAGLPRRPRVVLVNRGEPTGGLWQHAVAVGAEHVIALPDGESWLVAALADAAEGPGRSGRVVAVVGGRGGAGASVLAAAIAVAAAADGERAMLVDCDPLGGGLDLLLGAEEAQGVRWPDLSLSEGRVPASSLRAALPAPAIFGSRNGGLTVLSCDRAGGGPRPGAVTSVLDAGRRAGETVVCDVPRYPTDAALAALDAADLTVLVVPAEVRSCAAAARVLGVLRQRGGSVRLLVRGPAPGGLTPRDVAAALGLPLLHAMRPQPGLAGALDKGAAPGRRRGPLADAARAVLDELNTYPNGRRGEVPA
jgi:secretion/DNA translocation related CpaE-like protein